MMSLAPITDPRHNGGYAPPRPNGADAAAAEPTPLMRETPPAEPYPAQALGPLCAAAEAIHDMTQAPFAIAAQSVLGVAALATQGLADVEALHGPAPVSLFLLTVAQSGERKSACDRLAMRAVRAYEAELAEQYRAEVTAWTNALEVWQAQRKAILATAKDDAAAARADLDRLGPEPEGPLYPVLVTTEPTIESITKNMDRLRPALGLFADEGGAFLGGYAMSADHKLRTMTALSSFWDGSPVDRWRAGDGVHSYRGRRLAAHLMVQPVVAEQLLADPIARGQGFLARFLFAAPESAIGTRLRLGHDPGSDAALSAFEARIAALLRRPMPLRDGSRNELDPPLLRLSAEARARLGHFALAVEGDQRPGAALEHVRPAASKAAEQAARLAAVLTLYADLAADAIGAGAMDGGIALAAWYLAEAERLADAAVISAAIADAERMRRWILDSWSEPAISVADATQRGPFRVADRARAALRVVERHGWLIPIEGGAEVLGRHRREAWRIMRG